MKPTNDDNVAVYRNDVFVKSFQDSGDFYADAHNAITAEYIVSEGVLYDMSDAKSIKSIVIPKFKDFDGMPNTALDMAYHFQVRLKCEEREDIVVALARKTADLMLKSPITSNKKDFYRVVIQLWLTGHYDEGDRLLEYLKEKSRIVAAESETEEIAKQAFRNDLILAKELKMDYIVSSGGNCCEKCVLYRNRIYSLSGADKRFPKFSDYISSPEKLCCLNFYGTYYNRGDTLTEYRYYKDGSITEFQVDALRHSNRPFVDDRSEYQKELIEEWKKKQEIKRERDELYYSRAYWIEEHRKHQEYENIVALMGEKAPKSYSGYMRMKKNNTQNFQKILKIASENGVEIKKSKSWCGR